MLSKKVLTVVLLLNLVVLAPVQTALAAWTYVPGYTETLNYGDSSQTIEHPAGWRNDTGGFVQGEKKPTEGSGRWAWTPARQDLMGSGDSVYYVDVPGGWTEIITGEFQPGTQGAPPGEVVREIGNINSEPIGLWGMVYQDRYGVSYNQGRMLDPKVFTPARIAAERGGTATAEAQAAAAEDGFLGGGLFRLVLTVALVIATSGVGGAFVAAGTSGVGAGLAGQFVSLYGAGTAMSLAGAVAVNEIVQEVVFCATGLTCGGGGSSSSGAPVTATPVAGGPCAGPVNSCNQAYEGAWQGSVCSATTAPPDSNCPITCTPPQTLVNGVCTAPAATCTPPQTLVNGVCTAPAATCTPPQTLVNGVCTAPSVPSISALSLAGPGSRTIPYQTTRFFTPYTITNGGVSPTCELLDYRNGFLAYNPCSSGSITWDTPQAPPTGETYGYYFKVTSGSQSAENYFTVTVGAAPGLPDNPAPAPVVTPPTPGSACENGATNPEACDQCPNGSAFVGQSCASAGASCGPAGCSGAGGTPYDPVGALSCNNGAVNPGGGCSIFAPSVSFSADPSIIDVGQSSTLSWSSSDADSCTGVGFTAGGSSGSRSSGALNSPGIIPFQITCSGAGGSASASASVEVLKPVADISVNPARVQKGSPSQISWSASGIASCTVSGPSGVIASGAASAGHAFSIGSPASIPITTQSIFTITCQTRGAPISKSAMVNVVPTYQEF